MTASKWLLAISVFLLCECGIVGCAWITEPFADYARDKEGNVLLLDTPRNWELWCEAVDPQIATEVAGMSPPGFSTWKEKWLRQISALEESQQNFERYVEYIRARRREAGLPEIEDLP